MDDDAQLIDETLAGRRAAYGELVHKHQDRLFRTMVHVTGCREEAEDVVQEAFVQALVKLEGFHRQSTFYTWLYRIAFNMAMSRRRKRRPQASIEQARALAGVDPLDGGESAPQRLLREERASQLHAALAALSEEHRSILVLREMEDCDYETIGEVLGLPPGTVRSRLHRARSQLREELKKTLQENPAK